VLCALTFAFLERGPISNLGEESITMTKIFLVPSQ
jgi:hypothetical protein